MSKGGSPRTGSSGNGNPPKRYEVSRSDFYLQCRANIEERFPLVRAHRVLDQIKACAQLFPPSENAERVSDKTWLIGTQAGINIPEIDVYLTFEKGRVHFEAAFAQEGTAR